MIFTYLQTLPNNSKYCHLLVKTNKLLPNTCKCKQILRHTCKYFRILTILPHFCKTYKWLERILPGVPKKVCSSFLGKRWSNCLLITSFTQRNAQTLLYNLTKFYNYWTYTNHRNHKTTRPGALVGLAKNRHVYCLL